MSSGVAARRSASASEAQAQASAPSAAVLHSSLDRQKRKRLAMLEAENFVDTDEGRHVARRRDSELGGDLDDEYVSQAPSGAAKAKKSKKEKFATASANGQGKGKGGAGLAPASAPAAVLSHSSIESAHRNRRPIMQIMAEQWPEHYELFRKKEEAQQSGDAEDSVAPGFPLGPPSASWFSASAGPSKYPSRPFCSVCGYSSKYVCHRCAAKYCTLKCMKVHQDTRCQKFVA